jgi:hypothetical protein
MYQELAPATEQVYDDAYGDAGYDAAQPEFDERR